MIRALKAMAATVEEALLTRRSVRAFRPEPVPRAEVERLLALASRSASNSNCQPWHVHVLTGEPKRRLTEALWQALHGDGRVPNESSPTSRPPRTGKNRSGPGGGGSGKAFTATPSASRQTTPTGGSVTTAATTTSSAPRSA